MTIDEICEKYEIENYTINPDGSIDVYGNVFLYKKGLTELPLTFNKVTGYFDCSVNDLTTLKGSPKWVDGDFYCSWNNNKLTSLEFSPDYVGNDFYCSHSGLTDLIGSPKYIGGDFVCGHIPELINPRGCPEKMGGVLYCDVTPIGSIFTEVDQFFLHAFNFYKIIKDNTINLKRLKYVMDLYDKPIDLDQIKEYYVIK